MARNPYPKNSILHDSYELEKFKGVMHEESHKNMSVQVVKNKGFKKRRHGEYNLLIKLDNKVINKVDLKERFNKRDFDVHFEDDKLTIKYAVENGSIYLGYSDDAMYDDFGINHVSQYDVLTGELLNDKKFSTMGRLSERSKDSKEHFNELIGVKTQTTTNQTTNKRKTTEHQKEVVQESGRTR